MEKNTQNENNLKKAIDNILIINLYILILGSLLFIVSVILSVNGNIILYNLFQRLWFPVFIPVLSLFFTAILIEAVFSNIKKTKDKS